MILSPLPLWLLVMTSSPLDWIPQHPFSFLSSYSHHFLWTHQQGSGLRSLSMLFSQPGEHLFQLVFSILSCKFKYCVTREACPWELGTQCPLTVAVLSLFSLHLNSLHGAYYNLAHAHAHTQHTNTCIHINRHKHIYTHIGSFPHTCTHIYTCTPVYIHTHVHTCIYTYTHDWVLFVIAHYKRACKKLWWCL